MKRFRLVIVTCLLIACMAQVAFAAEEGTETSPFSLARAASDSVSMGGNGTLSGSTSIGVFENTYKFCNSVARTSRTVSRIRARVEPFYSSTGASLNISENSNWIYDTNYAVTSDCETLYVMNTLTGRADGFLNTRITAYGTGDAILNGVAYAVYTNTSR